MFYFLLHVCEVIRSFIVVLEVIFVIFYKLLIIFLLFQNMDMAVSVPEVAEEVEISSLSVLPAEAAVPGPHLYGEAVTGNVHLVSALERDESLLGPALRCILAAKAPGTVRGYSSALKFFKKFCQENGLVFEHLSTDMVYQYILHLDNSGASFATLAKVKPAITFYTQSLDKPCVFTPGLDLLIKGAENRALQRRGPVRKAPEVSASVLASLLTVVYLPFVADLRFLDPSRFRTVFRVVVIYHTLCRLDCFRKLRACHFELVGDDICVLFPAAKNDQLHQGNKSCLTKTDTPFCPVALVKAFFRRFGLRFGEAAGDQSFVNFQIRRERGQSVPIFSRSLSYSAATTDLRRLMRGANLDPDAVTDKSIKMAGVTAAFSAGATAEQLMHAGRWRTPTIALHYKHNTLAFKKEVAAKIPPLLGPVL